MLVAPDGNALAASGVLKVSLADVATTTHVTAVVGTLSQLVIKNAPAKLFNVYAINNAAADRYAKIYNKASLPVVGVDVPFRTLKVATMSTATLSLPMGTTLTNGLAIACTVLATDLDVTIPALGEVLIDIDFA
jgi:hypothetical protein